MFYPQNKYLTDIHEKSNAAIRNLHSGQNMVMSSTIYSFMCVSTFTLVTID